MQSFSQRAKRNFGIIIYFSLIFKNFFFFSRISPFDIPKRRGTIIRHRGMVDRDPLSCRYIYPSPDVLSLAKSIYVREDKSRKREKRCTVMASSGVVPVIIYEAQSAHITEITSPIRRTPPFPRRIYILSRMFRIAPCWPAIRKLFIYTILKFALSCQNFPIYWVGN